MVNEGIRRIPLFDETPAPDALRLIQSVHVAGQFVTVHVALPPRNAGYSAADILGRWKVEVRVLKERLRHDLAGRSLLLSGPMTVHMAAYTVEALRTAARNILIQDAATGDYLRVSGIDPDAQVQEAVRKSAELRIIHETDD